MIAVQVWTNRYAVGWRGDPLELGAPDGPDENDQTALEVALKTAYSSDAHAVPYAVYHRGELLDTAPRIRKEALAGLGDAEIEVLFGCLFVDVDHPTKEPTDGWYAAERDKLTGAGMAYAYRTRGGYRLVWLLERPASPEQYEALHAAVRRQLASIGVEADSATTDWTRCYRLPYVVRDGQRQVYDLEELAGEPLPVELAAADKPARFEGLAEAGPKRVTKEITAGERNRALASAAGILRRAGFDAEEISAALEVANDKRCDPPLPRSEVVKIARSIGNYAGPEQLGGDPRPADGDRRTGDGVELELGSEAELADLILARYLEGGGAPPVRYDRGSLWVYDADSGIWTALPTSAIARCLADLDGAPIGVGKARRYLRIGAATCRNVASLIEAYRDAPGWFADRPAGIAFAGGVVRVDNGRLYHAQKDPAHRLTHALPFAWDPSATCPTFDRVLERCFRGCPDADERIELLLGFIGVCLLGRASTYQKALLLVGEGANGKSTILDVGAALFPPRGRSAVPPQMLGDSYHRAELAGVLINIVSEVPESDIVAAEAFRAFVDGSEIVARPIRQAPFTFRPTAGHLFAANNLPGAKDFSHAFWRRWLAIEFPNVIPEEEQERGLSAKITAEELPGVARRVLEAAARVDARGSYAVPASSQGTVDMWRKDADQVANFAAERLVADQDASTTGSRVYEIYQLWARQNGHRPLANRRFSARLEKLGFRKTRTSNARIWRARVASNH